MAAKNDSETTAKQPHARVKRRGNMWQVISNGKRLLSYSESEGGEAAAKKLVGYINRLALMRAEDALINPPKP